LKRQSETGNLDYAKRAHRLSNILDEVLHEHGSKK
jgi:hypothetical protein